MEGKPISEEEFIKIHRADFNQRGFDEQTACFAWYIFQLEIYDQITYEKQDDLVITYQSGAKLLIQVKSSVGDSANMTDASEAFWSTMENWLDFNDTQSEMFPPNVRYRLHTNMEITNKFAKAICQLRNGDIFIEDVVNTLKSLSEHTTCENTVKRLLRLGNNKLNKFLMKIEFVDKFDALRMMYRKFLNEYKNPSKADKIVEELVGRLLTHKMDAAKKRVNWCYQKQNFINQFRDILNKVADDALTAIEYDVPMIMPNDYQNMVFARQLASIGVVNIEDDQDPELLEYYGYLLQCENSISYFYQIQLLNGEGEAAINKNAVEKWKIPFAKHSRQAERKGDTPEAIKEAGADCFYEVMDKDIPYGTGLSRTIIAPLSKGWFLRLSNKTPPAIKWRKDWK